MKNHQDLPTIDDLQIQVAGKNVEVGEALTTRIQEGLSASILKYFERGGTAEVTLSKQGHLFRADCWLRLASGQTLVSQGTGGDAHAAFDDMLNHIEVRIRRYKRRLKNHHAPSRVEPMPVTVLRDMADEEELDDGLDHSAAPQALIIAETEAHLPTLTVSAAVLEMDLSSYPVMVFRNAAHGGISVIYRRPDGHIGWIDPERTQKRTAA